jgi:tricorn protease-like protein
VGAIAWAPSISRKGNQLAYQRMAFKDNLFRLDLKDEKHPQGPPVLLRSEKGFNWRPHFSPDGKRVVFESNGLGYSDLWTCDRDGSNCGPITSLRGTAGAARWSPDGRFIAFELHLLTCSGESPLLVHPGNSLASSARAPREFVPEASPPKIVSGTPLWNWTILPTCRREVHRSRSCRVRAQRRNGSIPLPIVQPLPARSEPAEWVRCEVRACALQI